MWKHTKKEHDKDDDGSDEGLFVRWIDVTHKRQQFIQLKWGGGGVGGCS